jgi:hypothetical protein
MRTKCLIGGFLALALTIAPSGLHAEESSPLFVVYGNLYYNASHNMPVDGGYTIAVTNETKGTTRSVPVGIGNDAGKFCVVFVDFSGAAIREGDCLAISVHPMQGQYVAGNAPKDLLDADQYCVTAADVREMKLMLNIELSAIGTDPCTWGAVKSLYSR